MTTVTPTPTPIGDDPDTAATEYTTPRTPTRRGEPLDPGLLERLRRTVLVRGVPATAKLIGGSPSLVTRACAGYPILAGSQALIRERLP